MQFENSLLTSGIGILERTKRSTTKLVRALYNELLKMQVKRF
tara:strand:+ start:481 stop:606 length:126 start_codon:yes stop_codon:yes gene_type:complete